MSDELNSVGTRVSAQLKQLDEHRKKVGLDGFSELERLDPDTAALAKNVFANREKAAGWFTGHVPSLGRRTPWQCIADGEREQVHRILNAIAHGDLV